MPLDVKIVTPNSIDSSLRTLKRMKNGTIHHEGAVRTLDPEEKRIRKELKTIGAPQYPE
jgi:hypothetical protein